MEPLLSASVDDFDLGSMVFHGPKSVMNLSVNDGGQSIVPEIALTLPLPLFKAGMSEWASKVG